MVIIGNQSPILPPEDKEYLDQLPSYGKPSLEPRTDTNEIHKARVQIPNSAEPRTASKKYIFYFDRNPLAVAFNQQSLDILEKKLKPLRSEYLDYSKSLLANFQYFKQDQIPNSLREKLRQLPTKTLVRLYKQVCPKELRRVNAEDIVYPALNNLSELTATDLALLHIYGLVDDQEQIQKPSEISEEIQGLVYFHIKEPEEAKILIEELENTKYLFSKKQNSLRPVGNLNFKAIPKDYNSIAEATETVLNWSPDFNPDLLFKSMKSRVAQLPNSTLLKLYIGFFKDEFPRFHTAANFILPRCKNRGTLDLNLLDLVTLNAFKLPFTKLETENPIVSRLKEIVKESCDFRLLPKTTKDKSISPEFTRQITKPVCIFSIRRSPHAPHPGILNSKVIKSHGHIEESKKEVLAQSPEFDTKLLPNNAFDRVAALPYGTLIKLYYNLCQEDFAGFDPKSKLVIPGLSTGSLKLGFADIVILSAYQLPYHKLPQENQYTQTLKKILKEVVHYKPIAKTEFKAKVQELIERGQSEGYSNALKEELIYLISPRLFNLIAESKGKYSNVANQQDIEELSLLGLRTKRKNFFPGLYDTVNALNNL